MQEESRRYRESLIEEENTHEEGMLTGRLENNLLVHFKGCKEQIGTMADVKLVEEKGFYYNGRADPWLKRKTDTNDAAVYADQRRE